MGRLEMASLALIFLFVTQAASTFPSTRLHNSNVIRLEGVRVPQSGFEDLIGDRARVSEEDSKNLLTENPDFVPQHKHDLMLIQSGAKPVVMRKFLPLPYTRNLARNILSRAMLLQRRSRNRSKRHLTESAPATEEQNRATVEQTGITSTDQVVLKNTQAPAPPPSNPVEVLQRLTRLLDRMLRELSQFGQKFTLRLIRMTERQDIDQMQDIMKDFEISAEKPIFFIAGGLRLPIGGLNNTLKAATVPISEGGEEEASTETVTEPALVPETEAPKVTLKREARSLKEVEEFDFFPVAGRSARTENPYDDEDDLSVIDFQEGDEAQPGDLDEITDPIVGEVETLPVTEMQFTPENVIETSHSQKVTEEEERAQLVPEIVSEVKVAPVAESLPEVVQPIFISSADNPQIAEKRLVEMEQEVVATEHAPQDVTKVMPVDVTKVIPSVPAVQEVVMVEPIIVAPVSSAQEIIEVTPGAAAPLSSAKEVNEVTPVVVAPTSAVQEVVKISPEVVAEIRTEISKVVEPSQGTLGVSEAIVRSKIVAAPEVAPTTAPETLNELKVVEQIADPIVKIIPEVSTVSINPVGVVVDPIPKDSMVEVVAVKPSITVPSTIPVIQVTPEVEQIIDPVTFEARVPVSQPVSLPAEVDLIPATKVLQETTEKFTASIPTTTISTTFELTTSTPQSVSESTTPHGSSFVDPPEIINAPPFGRPIFSDVISPIPVAVKEIVPVAFPMVGPSTIPPEDWHRIVGTTVPSNQIEPDFPTAVKCHGLEPSTEPTPTTNIVIHQPPFHLPTKAPLLATPELVSDPVSVSKFPLSESLSAPIAPVMAPSEQVDHTEDIDIAASLPQTNIDPQFGVKPIDTVSNVQFPGLKPSVPGRPRPDYLDFVMHGVDTADNLYFVPSRNPVILTSPPVFSGYSSIADVIQRRQQLMKNYFSGLMFRQAFPV